MKNVGIDDTTSFLDNVHLGCTQRECKPIETIVEQYKNMLESRFLLKQMENYWDVKSRMYKQKRGLVTWKDMLKKMLNDTANWQTRK